MKKYAGSKKWTQGKSTVTRPTDQTHFLRGLKESAKMVLAKLPGSERKKRSWEK